MVSPVGLPVVLLVLPVGFAVVGLLGHLPGGQGALLVQHTLHEGRRDEKPFNTILRFFCVFGCIFYVGKLPKRLLYCASTQDANCGEPTHSKSPLEWEPAAYTGLMEKSSQLMPSITGTESVFLSSQMGARRGGSQLKATCTVQYSTVQYSTECLRRK